MREIHTREITKQVSQLCQSANFDLGEDILSALRRSIDKEDNPLARDILQQIIDNAMVAREERVPICQDCGVAVFFVEIGQDVHVVGGSITDAINEGVRLGYNEGFLRRSIVASPIRRINTGDNTPAVIHYDVVAGDKLRIMFAPKGAGSENMSQLKMLNPSDGLSGIKSFVVNCVKEAGPNPCPPIVVGVGIGGTFEKSALMAKKALFRPIDEPNLDEDIRRLEAELLNEINSLGIGPAGLGGSTTALAVLIETFPCHIGSLPVAVNINCHASRHKEVTI